MKITVDIPEEELEKMSNLVSILNPESAKEWNSIRNQWVGRILGRYWERNVFYSLKAEIKERENGQGNICQ